MGWTVTGALMERSYKTSEFNGTNELKLKFINIQIQKQEQQHQLFNTEFLRTRLLPPVTPTATATPTQFVNIRCSSSRNCFKIVSNLANLQVFCL